MVSTGQKKGRFRTILVTTPTDIEHYYHGIIKRGKFIIVSNIEYKDQSYEVSGELVTDDRMVLYFVHNTRDPEEGKQVYYVVYNGVTYDFHLPFDNIEALINLSEVHSLQSFIGGDEESGVGLEHHYLLLIKPEFENYIMNLQRYLKFVEFILSQHGRLQSRSKLQKKWIDFAIKLNKYIKALDHNYPDLITLALQRLPGEIKIFVDSNYQTDPSKMLDNLQILMQLLLDRFESVDDIPVFDFHNSGEYPDIIEILDAYADQNPFPDFDIDVLIKQHLSDIQNHTK